MAKPTPLTQSADLSAVTGARIYLKWENLQTTGSFKLRGAYHKIHSLGRAARNRGVITASAGNHGIAVAYVAERLGLRATVVVPTSAPRVKVEKCRRFGADVVVRGSYYDESVMHCMRIASETEAEYIPATEDIEVMAGQGTVACEILDERPDARTLLVPVGGGGLIAGVAVLAKSRRKDIRVLGVQSTAARTMHDSFHAGKLIEVPYRPTVADGLAGGTTQMKLDIVREYVDDIVLASEERLRQSIVWLHDHEEQVAEGAGVVGPSALLEGKVPLEEAEEVVVVVSGGNVDRKILERRDPSVEDGG